MAAPAAPAVIRCADLAASLHANDPTLVHLDLSGVCNLLVLEALAVNSTVQTLAIADFTSCQTNDPPPISMDDCAATKLASALTTNRSLTQIDIKAYGVGDSGVAHIAEALKVNATLRAVGLTVSPLIDHPQGLARVAEALEVNRSLAQLSLQFLGPGEIGGVKRLAQALQINTTLVRLGLAGNGLAEQGGAFELARAIRSNTSLNLLSLESNGLTGTDAWAAIAGALEHNHTLTALNLQDNDLGEEGAVLLADCLSVNTSLAGLSLYGCGIGNRGLLRLGQVLRRRPAPHSPDLDTFALHGVKLSDIGGHLGLPWPEAAEWDNTTILRHVCKLRRERALAFTMGQHARLGQRSRAATLNDNVLHQIFRHDIG